MVVFDKFPSTKVKDLLQIVNPGGEGVDGASATVAPQKLPTPSHSSLSGKASLLIPLKKKDECGFTQLYR